MDFEKSDACMHGVLRNPDKERRKQVLVLSMKEQTSHMPQAFKFSSFQQSKKRNLNLTHHQQPSPMSSPSPTKAYACS